MDTVSGTAFVDAAPPRPHNPPEFWNVDRLGARRPDLSARTINRPAQSAALLTFAVLAVWAAIVAPAASEAVWRTAALVAFGGAIALRIGAALAYRPEPSPPTRMRDDILPSYAVLVPVYREADAIPGLIAALQRLDYPADRLDIVLIAEEDDAPTRRAIAAAIPAGSSPFRLFLSPPHGPRTKPKALNAALDTVNATLVCVFDAEDRPHPNQLRAAAAAFAGAGPHLGCVQAPLLIDNLGAGWLSRQFAAEYAIHFLLIAPFLSRLGLASPLGGTSNHFRRAALEAVDRWDAYNVTEDADLAFRLARMGYKIGVVAPATFEEAPTRLSAWRRQRQRWIKGFAITWLVHMRNPSRTAREMGLPSFIMMQVLLAGSVASALAFGPMLASAMATIATSGVAGLHPHDAMLLIGGYGASVLAGAAAAVRLRDADIALTALTAPLYWALFLLAAAPAALELFVRPHYWAKTDHALCPRKPPPCPSSTTTPSILG